MADLTGRILLVEDEEDVAAFVTLGLREEGYAVTWVDHGGDPLLAGDLSDQDLVLLDVRLPDESGHSVCRRLRARHPELPILMLTALDSVEDRVAGLNAGADDYLGKPFAFEELLARIAAHLRRRPSRRVSEPLTLGDMELDPVAATCRIGGSEVALTPREYGLLTYLARHAGELCTRSELHRDVWGNDFDRGTNLINVYVNYVRSKLNSAGSSVRIETIRGRGYRLDAEGEGVRA